MIAYPARTAWRNKKGILAVLFASFAISGILGSVIAETKMPIEGKIELESKTPRVVSSHDYTIKYYSDGPEFIGFDWTHADFTIVSDHDAIFLASNGMGGAVELAIPAQLMKEYDSIMGKARVAEVKSAEGKELEFERISADDSFTTIRASLPSSDKGIRIFISSISMPMTINFALQALLYSGMVWVPLFLGGIFVVYAIERLKRRLS